MQHLVRLSEIYNACWQTFNILWHIIYYLWTIIIKYYNADPLSGPSLFRLLALLNSHTLKARRAPKGHDHSTQGIVCVCVCVLRKREKNNMLCAVSQAELSNIHLPFVSPIWTPSILTSSSSCPSSLSLPFSAASPPLPHYLSLSSCVHHLKSGSHTHTWVCSFHFC